MAKKNFVVPIIALLSVLGMTGCEKAASTSAPSIGENGNWWVDGTDTGVAAQGPKGDTGASPTISISEDGYWVINGTATDVKAEGTAGAPGQTPTVSINADGFWVINGVATDVSAQGPKGDPGTTPTVSINADGYWVINGVATDVKAEGTAGAPGSSPTVEIGIDDCWWINGVSTGMPAVAHDGNPGAPGAPGDPGATGPEGKSAFEIFMEHYPHYTGTEADWIKGVADGTLAANMPKAGHSGDWTYNPATGKIERTCPECGDIESKDAVLPSLTPLAIGDSSIDNVLEITNSTSYPWSYQDGAWKSGIKGVASKTSSLTFTSKIEVDPAAEASTLPTLTLHAHVSCEASWDYFSASITSGKGTNSIAGKKYGNPDGEDVDVTFTFTDKDADVTLSYTKDGSGDKGDDEAVVTNIVLNVPTSLVAVEDRPDVVVVNFDAGNGDADTQQLIWSGTGVNLPTPTRTGYSFGGWYSDAACTVPAPATFDASCTLHAKWVVTHKVTIVDPTPGSDDLVVTVDHNGVLDIETPTDDEKLFSGFYLLPSCAPGTEFDISSPIKRDTTIYCKWDDAPAYCGTYGGANIQGLAFGYNTSATITIAPNGTISGNKYTGGTVTGFDESDGSLIVDDLKFGSYSSSDKLYVVDDMIIGISAYGQDTDFWVFVKNQEPASDTNRFILNTGISNDGTSATKNKGRIFSVDREGVVTNYCIFGSTLYKNVTVSSLDGDFAIGLRSDSIEYVKDICVKDEDGNVITTQICQVSVADDYGVYTDAESHVLKVYGDNKTISLDGELLTCTKDGTGVYSFVEYSARKTVTSYKGTYWCSMNYDTEKGCWVHDDNSGSSHVYTDTPYTDPDISWRKENSVFVFGEDVIAGNAFVTLVGDSFEISRPTFTVTTHIAENSEETTVRVGRTVTLEAPEVAATQQFEGWFTNPEFSGDPITEMTATGDAYAKIVNIYKLIVHKNLTEEDTSETLIFHADEVMTPPEVSLDGAEFIGWYTDASFETPYVPAANVESVEIYAKWIKGKYANSAANWFDSFDPSGDFISEITWDGGIYAWKQDTLEIDDVVYEGIKSGNYHSTTPSNISVTFKADAVVSFDWFTAGESKYDYLRIYKNGNVIINGYGKATTAYGNPDATPYHESAVVIVSAGDVLKFSFTQDGTFYEPDCGFIYNLSIAAPSSVDLVLDPNYEGGTPVITPVNVGYAIVPTNSAARAGYVFDGWYLEATCETPFAENTIMTASGLTLYAKWAEAVDLTVHAGDDTVVMPVKPNTAPDMSAFNKAGFVIVGYYAESTFETPVDLSCGIAEDTEVFIKYLDATVFVGKYVGYNLYSSTLDQVKTGTDITSGYYISSFNESLVGVDGKASGKTITGYSDGVLTTTGGSVLAAIADDGTVFLCNRYSGFTDTASITSGDLMFAVNTGDTYDGTVTIVGTKDSSNNYVVTVTKGGKIYTVYLNLTANTMTITSVVDAE